MYKDITSYSRDVEERKPKVLENDVNGITFRVHKYIYCGEQWFLTCREFNIQQESLYTEDMEEAKVKGIKRMKELLNEKIDKFQKALKQLNENS